MDVKAPDEEGPAPSYCMLDLSVSGDGVQYAFIQNGTRFYTSIHAEKLRGEGNVLDQFNGFREDLDNLDTLFHFEDWVLGALEDFLSRVAPTATRPPSRKSVTLLDYFSCPAYAFELVNKSGKLHAVQRDYDPRIHGGSNPRTRIVDSQPDSTEDVGLSSSNGGTIPRSSLPSVPHFFASELERVYGGLLDEELSDMPKKVRRVGSDDVFFFKAGLSDHSRLREMELLSKINQNRGKFDSTFRTSKIVGLVLWDDDKSILMGFLLEYIEGKSLAWRMQDASTEDKKKWTDQVEATLKRLHEVDIIWGDVKPENVMINADGDAVIVDFEGGYALERIESEDEQTACGDLIGLDCMRNNMGI